jgi:outer membrane protein OmpA-like peptidoglycan-associated protein
VRAAAAVIAVAAMPIAQAGCADNQLPPRPLPPGDGPRALPAWYPERPWSAADGQSQVLIEGKVVFETDRSEIRPGSEKVLETLLKFLKNRPDVTRLRIEGHTDARASEEHNQELSARRSLAVCNWLVDRGIEPTRLLAVGFGEAKPLAPNEIAPGRAENRRTEFHVVELDGSLFQTKDPTAGGLELVVPSLEERRRAAEPVAVPVAPPRKPFRPTGDVVQEVEPKPARAVDPDSLGAKQGS